MTHLTPGSRPPWPWTESRFALPCLAFAQMLPATLLTPAIRPLFAALHAGDERGMHAFMAVNMLGGVLMAPLLARRADVRARPERLLAMIAALDGLLLMALALPIPTLVVLVLRALEGGLHVSAGTVLMGRAAMPAQGRTRALAAAGAAIMAAVAVGSALGSGLMTLDPRAPFWFGGAISLGVALAATRMPMSTPRTDRLAGGRTVALLRTTPALLIPATAAFMSRFVIGCLVVTFSLFAHRAHGLSDRSIGVLFTFLTFPFAFGTYPAGRLTERVPRIAVLSAGAVLLATTTFGLRTVGVVWLPGWMALMGVACALVFAPTLGYAAVLAPQGSGTRALSLVNAASCLGMLLGPAAAGITTAVVGTGTVEAYRAVFLVASASVVLWLFASAPWTARRLAEELRDWRELRAGREPGRTPSLRPSP